MSETSEWFQFQEEICAYFESIGAIAETNVTIQGVRTSHDIDVLVKTKFLGEDLIWMVIPPFITGLKSRYQATMANFCLGVMPPSPILGRSLL